MNAMNELSILYEKIRDNTATDYERFVYNIEVQSSCMDEKLLLEKLEHEYLSKKAK